MQTPVKIILLGPPGSGKDTHAAILSATFRIPSISMGGILREEIVRQTPDGAIAAQAMQKGEMVSEEIVDRLVKQKLQSDDCARGYILNGYTRSLNALKKYLSMDRPTHVIHLMLSDDDVRERLKDRGRYDDLEQVIDVRLRRYHKDEVPVAETLKADPTLHFIEIWTNRAPLSITKDMIDFLHGTLV